MENSEIFVKFVSDFDSEHENLIKGMRITGSCSDNYGIAITCSPLGR